MGGFPGRLFNKKKDRQGDHGRAWIPGVHVVDFCSIPV
jgi:hypothetical protein